MDVKDAEGRKLSHRFGEVLKSLHSHNESVTGLLVCDEFGFLVYRSEEFPASIDAASIHAIHAKASRESVTFDGIKGVSIIVHSIQLSEEHAKRAATHYPGSNKFIIAISKLPQQQ
eukprot:TRINITY_DN808_c0_g1_i1.p1 TRINITY_DN808_c0_g1~~TRINITY_DN808_c0_g1_i1.p1  ORF type:complete len:116 (+),score=28.84 TRINITY_DN808_c0_g1_i1:37-384(+)